MRPVSHAVVRAGIVTKDALRELMRWGSPVADLMDEHVIDAKTPEEVLNIIHDALDQEDQTIIRESDLEIVKMWLKQENQYEGKLQLPVDGRKATYKVTFCRTLLGEYVIPWNSETISELILTVESSLTYEKDGVKKKVHFTDLRELFVGDHKAFMVCSGEEV